MQNTKLGCKQGRWSVNKQKKSITGISKKKTEQNRLKYIKISKTRKQRLGNVRREQTDLKKIVHAVCCIWSCAGTIAFNLVVF